MFHFGTKLYGRVDRVDGTCIATLFLHVAYIPVVPLRSFVVLEEHGDGTFDSIRIRLSLRSVLHAFLPVGGDLAADERAQRQVYAQFIGHPVDPQRLPEERRDELRRKLEHALAEHARMHEAGLPYRATADESTTDPRILAARLTLARLDGDEAAHQKLWNQLRLTCRNW